MTYSLFEITEKSLHYYDDEYSIWEFLYYDPKTGQIEKSALSELEMSHSSEISCYLDMKFDSQGGMWLATCENGLYYFPDPLQGGAESWQHYSSNIGLPGDEIRNLYIQTDKIIWVGTKEGLARCEIQTP